MRMQVLVGKMQYEIKNIYTNKAIFEIIGAFCRVVEKELSAGREVIVPKFGMFHAVTKTIALNFNEGHKIERPIVKFKPFGRLTKTIRGQA